MTPSSLLAIDPGFAMPGSACAHFTYGELDAVEMWDSIRAPRPFCGVERVVIEKPQRDDRTRHIGDSYEKLFAAYEIAIEAYADARIKRYTPRQWKGSWPKPQHHRRVWEALTDHERRALPIETEARIADACERGALNRWTQPGASYYRGWKGHNLLDAVALGLFDLGRIGR